MKENMNMFAELIINNNLSNSELYRATNELSSCLKTLADYGELCWTTEIGASINQKLLDAGEISQGEYDRRILNTNRERDILYAKAEKCCDKLNSICTRLHSAPVFDKSIFDDKSNLYNFIKNSMTAENDVSKENRVSSQRTNNMKSSLDYYER